MAVHVSLLPKRNHGFENIARCIKLRPGRDKIKRGY